MIWRVKETGSKQLSIMFPPKIAAALAERLSVSEQRAFIREAVAEKLNREFNLNFSESDYATRRGKRTDVETNAAEVLPVLQARAKKARERRETYASMRRAIEEFFKKELAKARKLGITRSYVWLKLASGETYAFDYEIPSWMRMTQEQAEKELAAKGVDYELSREAFLKSRAEMLDFWKQRLIDLEAEGKEIKSFGVGLGKYKAASRD